MSRQIRGTSAAVAALVMLATSAALLTSNDGNAQEDPVRRLAGETRFATAGALASHVDGDTLWVATGFAFTDALAASATGSGPVLLVARHAAPQATVEAASHLEGIQRVRAVGGSAAVSDAALQAVADAVGAADVERIAGTQRFETAARISQQAHPAGAAVAYIATGLAFPDGLTASVAAAEANAPVLLATRNELPAATRSELDRLAPAEIVVVGGRGAVGAQVKRELSAYAEEVTRVAGADRFATAAAVSAHRGISPNEAFVATGEDFPDVLAAAPAAITADAALLLSGRAVLPQATRTELRRLGVERATITGGHSAVSQDVADAVREILDSFEGVIVTLDVEWRPEGELSDSELREQRARIEAAQDQVLEDLGSHGRLGRRLTATAQMAVDVDAQGRRLLEQHELVAAVDDETLDRPSSSTE